MSSWLRPGRLWAHCRGQAAPCLIDRQVARLLALENPRGVDTGAATKFELVINLGTATALGITVPNAMQLLADEVIE
jgi:ABC-type uncharacterized transport system substrate-binding protein